MKNNMKNNMKIFLSALVATIKWLLTVAVEVLAALGFYILIGHNMSWQSFGLLYIVSCLVMDLYIMKGE